MKKDKKEHKNKHEESIIKFKKFLETTEKIVGNSLSFTKTIHFPVLHGAIHITKCNLTVVRRIG